MQQTEVANEGSKTVAVFIPISTLSANTKKIILKHIPAMTNNIPTPQASIICEIRSIC